MRALLEPCTLTGIKPWDWHGTAGAVYLAPQLPGCSESWLTLTLPQRWPTAGTSSTAGNKVRLSSPFSLDLTPHKKTALFCRSRRIAPGPTRSTTIPSGRESGVSELLSGLCCTDLKKLNGWRGWKLTLVIHTALRPFGTSSVRQLGISPQAQVGQSQETTLTRIALVLYPLTAFKLQPSLLIYLFKLVRRTTFSRKMDIVYI